MTQTTVATRSAIIAATRIAAALDRASVTATAPDARRVLSNESCTVRSAAQGLESGRCDEEHVLEVVEDARRTLAAWTGC